MRDFDIHGLELAAENFIPIPTGDLFLDNRYDWQKNDNGVEWPYYRFFYHLSKMFQPRLVVELGGYQGTAAAHFAAGCIDTTVITIDHHTDPGDEVNKARMLDADVNYRNLIYIQGWTTNEEAEAQKGHHALGDVGSAYGYILQWPSKIDILFIDSWHVYDHARLDWAAYEPLLNSPALVICDDIQAGGGPESPISGMLDFWNELSEPKFLNSTLHPGTNMGFLKV